MSNLADLTTLRTQILAVIQDENFNVADLKTLLDPVFTYVDNPLFDTNLSQIVDILTEDRNGDVQFTIDDLTLLARDLPAITSLFSCLLVAIQSIPELKLDYNEGTTELVMFKLLLYVCLVVIPSKTNIIWTYDEKVKILDTSISVYKMIQSTGIISNIVDNLYNLLKTRVFICKCLTSTPEPETTIDKNMPKAKIELVCAVNNIRNRSDMIAHMKAQIRMELNK